MGQEVPLAADLVVLSTGLEPAAGSAAVARQLRVSQTLYGWFQEAHQKLRPVDSATEGVFLCGVAHYPKSLGETVAQAQAAAIRAAGDAVPDGTVGQRRGGPDHPGEMPALPGLRLTLPLRGGAACGR